MAKLVMALIVAGLSYVYRLPIIVFISLGWCLWLWFVMSGRRKRLLVTLGFGLAALGWGVSFLERGFMLKIEGSHFPAVAEYWGYLANTSFWVGIGLMTAGVLLLAYVDYRRMPKPKPLPASTDGVEADQGHVWPPAPKHPQ